MAADRGNVAWHGPRRRLAEDVLVTDSSPGARRSRVLIADDRESIRALFHRLLSEDGHDVVLAPDGASALAAVHRHRPDVILLDVAMPLINGLEVCRQLKADPETRLTPVVLVSGQSRVGSTASTASRPARTSTSRSRSIPMSSARASDRCRA